MRSIKSKLLISIGIIVLIFSTILLHRTYRLVTSNIENFTKQQLSLSLNFDLAIREYVAEKVRPITLGLVPEGKFMPETMSTSYVARNIFEKVRRTFPDYIIKFSSDNPRNLLNKAESEELNMIKYFNDNPGEKIWTGEITMGGKQYFAKFSAMRMEKSCLRCHGDPADAPGELIERYGSTASFHLPLGKIVGLDTIAIPSDIVTQKLWGETVKNLGVLGIGILLLSISLVLIFKFVITDRLSKITEHFIHTQGQEEAVVEIGAIEIGGNDEIAALTSSFNKLANRLNDSYTKIKKEIEERKRAQGALKESEERYRTFFEQGPDGIVILDPKTAKFIEFNDQVCRQLGYSREEFAQSRVFDIEAKETARETQARIQKVLSEGYDDFETIHRTKQGKIRHVHVTAQVINITGRKVYHCIWRDITDRKRAEEERLTLEAQLQQAQKMESVGTLAGGIAHDFNNILGIILGNAELAMDDVPEWSPAKFNLKEVRTASLRAKDVVRQLLSFARKTRLEKKPTNIVITVKESLKLIRSSIPTSIEIHQNIPAAVDTILADPTQINQVLINLCTNANHAMPDGGIIEITLKNVALNENETAQYPDLNPGQYVNLTVSDTGHGIPKEEIDRIFDPYFTTKEVGKGTGMGLAVVHSIVKEHNGIITMKSELGKGTTFSIFFPAVEKDVVMESEPAEKLPMGNEKILFIDDEQSIVNMARQMLERLGYEVDTKMSSIEALELFRSKPDQFDLVITDLTMPKMTGDKLVKEILAIRPDIPIILCTGFSEKIDEKKATAIGTADYIEKPVDQRDFAIKVRKVLDEKKV